MLLIERKSLSDDTTLNYDAMHLFKIDIVLTAAFALYGCICSALKRRLALIVDPRFEVMHNLALTVILVALFCVAKAFLVRR